MLLICLAAASPPRLPPDEPGLAALLEEEAIDSLQYEQILVFYALPLSVPQGELPMLAQIFPEIGEMIPAAEQLEAYRPFDNRQIQRLFNDFPILADFEPVLRFNESISKEGGNGEVIFGINRSPATALSGHRVRFRAGTSARGRAPGRKVKAASPAGPPAPGRTPSQSGMAVSAEGNLALSGSGAMWQGRRVDLSYRGIKTQIGNFRQPVPGELFWGRFTALTAEEQGDVSANWLYGGTNSWNGISVEMGGIPGAAMLGGSAFCHVRPGETGAGGGVDLRVNRLIKMYFGVTGFAIGEDNIYTAHIYGEYKGKTWQTVLETGLPLGEDNVAAALSLRVSYRIKESFAQYHLVSYPDDFTAPVSRVKRQLLTESGEKTPPAPSQPPHSPPVQKHILKMTVPVPVPPVDMMKLIPDIEFTESGGAVKRVQGRTEIRARINTAAISVKHASRIFTMGIDSALHTSSASFSMQTGYPAEIRASVQSVYGYYKEARNTYALELPLTAVPNAVITPFIRGKYGPDHEFWYGLKSEIHLYKKTWTGVTIELPVNVKGAEGVYIKGSSSYSF
ncbi:MAG: hypothetical protein FWB85_05425 [Chitinispirillia bacterium]|nr:hypothetical protein [Chitinispirillia bacterium]MCL2241666.1 hypothetical protein [Chitinispirillia bacterium]